VVNSLTKLNCSVCQIGLSDFDSSNSAISFVKFQNRLFTPLGDIKGLSATRRRPSPSPVLVLTTRPRALPAWARCGWAGAGRMSVMPGPSPTSRHCVVPLATRPPPLPHPSPPRNAVGALPVKFFPSPLFSLTRPRTTPLVPRSPLICTDGRATAAPHYIRATAAAISPRWWAWPVRPLSPQPGSPSPF
jgi:hypothetical protein